MGRFILYLLIALGAAYSIAPIRARIEPPTARAWSHLTPYFNVVINPVKKDLVRREEIAIVGRMKEWRNEGHKVPEPGDFQDWLQQNISVGRDAWDNQYWMRVKDDDTTWIGSNGPDGLRDTDDDLVVQVTW
ncbi:MAG TPA: hypothetical protein VF832_03220 [Longimicrobiales bacterium]